MKRLLAIFGMALLVGAVLQVTRNGGRGESPPKAPVPAGPRSQAPYLEDPARQRPGGSEERGEPGQALAMPPSRPVPPTELVLIDGATGRRLRTESVPFLFDIPLAIARVPSPFVAGVESFEFEGRISALAERIRLTAVVWPELDLRVRVEDANGLPLAGAELTRIQVGGRARLFEAAESGASGEIRVRGLPWMREEPVFVVGRALDLRGANGNRHLTEVRPRTRHDFTFTGALPADPVRHRVALGDPVIKDAKVSDHNETDNDMPFEESLTAGNPSWLRVSVLRADGSAAAGVQVKVYDPRSGGGFCRWTMDAGRTDADGVLLLRFERETVAGVAVREPGFLFGDPVRGVATPERPELVLREAPGADLDVLVLDGEDRPLPGAEITVDDPLWAWLENGVQQLGLFTGPDGRVHLPRLPLREVRIRARYGTRRAQVVVEPPGPAVLRLVRTEQKD